MHANLIDHSVHTLTNCLSQISSDLSNLSADINSRIAMEAIKNTKCMLTIIIATEYMKVTNQQYKFLLLEVLVALLNIRSIQAVL